MSSSDPAWQAGLVAFLLTLALHSTALLAAAWLVARARRRVPDLVRERVWKFAAVAAILTSTLQCVVVARPVGGHVARLESRGPATAPVSAPGSESLLVGATRPGIVALDPAPAWPRWVLAFASLLAACSIARWGIQKLSLERLLARRQPVDDPRLLAIWQRVRSRTTGHHEVRLSRLQGLSTPITFGWFRPEVSIPHQLARELEDDEVAAMFAHELAHVEARDPLWLATMSWLVRLFPWQPLLRLARKGFRELAEFRCDARAAEIAGDRALARCLVEVAAWASRRRPVVRAGLAGMAVPGSMLTERVERVMQGGSRRVREPRRGWLALWFTLVVGGMTAAMPGAGVHATRTGIEAPTALLDVLVELDLECAALAAEFTSLQRELLGARVDREMLAQVRVLGERLNGLDRRRIRLRSRILQALSETREERR